MSSFIDWASMASLFVVSHQYLACCCQSAQEHMPMLYDSFPDTGLKTILVLTQIATHWTQKHKFRDADPRRMCEFGTKQRHLVYTRLESLQPKTFNAFLTQFWCISSELNKYFQWQEQVCNQPAGWFSHHLLRRHQVRYPNTLVTRLF